VFHFESDDLKVKVPGTELAIYVKVPGTELAIYEDALIGSDLKRP